MAAVCAGILLFGCSVIEKKPELAEYKAGVLSSTLDHSITDVQKATVGAYESLGLTIVEAKGDKLSGIVRGTLANGTEADTNLTPVDDKTNVGIKVGATGDEPFSYRILEAIRKKL